MPGAIWDGPGPERKPTANRYAIADRYGTLPVWSTQRRGYEYPPDPRLTELDEQNKGTRLLRALLQQQNTMNAKLIQPGLR